MTSVKRGEIYFADLSPVIGSEQGGVRPVLIIQNDVGNQHSPTTVEIIGKQNGLSKNSVILVEQVRTIDKQRLKEKICTLDAKIMEQVDKALLVSVGLTEIPKKCQEKVQ